MVLFKNKSFLSASILLAVLGNTALLPSFSFAMDEETEKKQSSSSTSVARPYPDERASAIEAVLAVFLNPQTSEEDRNKAGVSLLTEPKTFWEDSKKREYNQFFEDQILSVVENPQIPFLTRVAYAHSFLSAGSVPKGSFFSYSNGWGQSSPQTIHVSALLLQFLSEDNGSLTPTYCTQILNAILNFGERAQKQEASRRLLSSLKCPDASSLFSLKETYSILHNIVRTNQGSQFSIDAITHILPLITDLTNPLSTNDRTATAKIICCSQFSCPEPSDTPKKKSALKELQLQTAKFLFGLSRQQDLPAYKQLEILYGSAVPGVSEDSYNAVLSLIQASNDLFSSQRAGAAQRVISSGTEEQRDTAYTFLSSLSSEDVEELIEHHSFLDFIKGQFSSQNDTSTRPTKAAEFLSPLIENTNFSKERRLRFFNILNDGWTRNPKALASFVEKEFYVIIDDAGIPFPEKENIFTTFTNSMYNESDLKDRLRAKFLPFAAQKDLSVEERLKVLGHFVWWGQSRSSTAFVDQVKRAYEILGSLIIENATDSSFPPERLIESAKRIIEYKNASLKESVLPVLLAFGQKEGNPVSERLNALEMVGYASPKSSPQQKDAYKSFVTLFRNPEVYIPERSHLSTLINRAQALAETTEDERKIYADLIADIVQHAEYPLEGIPFGDGDSLYANGVIAALTQKLPSSYQSLNEWKLGNILNYMSSDKGTPASRDVLLSLFESPEHTLPLHLRLNCLNNFFSKGKQSASPAQKAKASALLWSLIQQQEPSQANHFHIYNLQHIMESGSQEHVGYVLPRLEALSQDKNLDDYARQSCARSIIAHPDVPEENRQRAQALLQSFRDDDPALPVLERIYRLTRIAQDQTAEKLEKQGAVDTLLRIAENPDFSTVNRIKAISNILHQHSWNASTPEQTSRCFDLLLPLCESPDDIPLETRIEAARQIFYKSPSDKTKVVLYRQRALDVLLPVMENPKTSIEKRFELLHLLDMGSSDTQIGRALKFLESLVESSAHDLSSRLSYAWKFVSLAGDKFQAQRGKMHTTLLAIAGAESTTLEKSNNILQSFLHYDAERKYGVTEAYKARARTLAGSNFEKQLVKAENADSKPHSRYVVAQLILDENGWSRGIVTPGQKTRATALLSSYYEELLVLAEGEKTPSQEKFSTAQSVLKREHWAQYGVTERQKLRARKLMKSYYDDQLLIGENEETSPHSRFHIAMLILNGEPWHKDFATDIQKERARTLLISYYNTLLETAENPAASIKEVLLAVQSVLPPEAWRDIAREPQKTRARALVVAYFERQLALLDAEGTSLEDRVKAAQTVLDTSVLDGERQQQHRESDYRKGGMASIAQTARARNHLPSLLAEWRQIPASQTIRFAGILCREGEPAQKDQACTYMLSMWKQTPTLTYYETSDIGDLVRKYGTDGQKVQIYTIFNKVRLSPEMENFLNFHARSILRYGEQKNLLPIILSLVQDWPGYGQAMHLIDQGLNLKKMPGGEEIPLLSYMTALLEIEKWIGLSLPETAGADAIRASRHNISQYDYLAQDFLSRTYTFMKEIYPDELGVWIEGFVQESLKAFRNKSQPVSVQKRCIDAMKGGIDDRIDAIFAALKSQES